MSDETKVAFPKKFCDYWWDNPLTWNRKRSGVCEHCTEPIATGEEYFEINVHEGDTKRGHLHHLEYAEPVEWIPREPKQ